MPERAEIIRVGRHEVKITRPDKILFPKEGITKRELVDYYRHIASWMLPYLRGRRLTLERFPDGIDGMRLIQKSVSAYFPEWIKTVTVKKVGGTVRHVLCEDEATLAYLANQACITPAHMAEPHRCAGFPGSNGIRPRSFKRRLWPGEGNCPGSAENSGANAAVRLPQD